MAIRRHRRSSGGLTGSGGLAPPAPATTGADPSNAQVVVCHATGFCKETLAPMIDEWEAVIDKPVHAMLVDGRGHGASSPHPGPFDWDAATDDLTALLAVRDEPLVGVGHSWGGGIVARAETKRPGTFSHLVLIEPVVLPGPFEPRDIPLSVAAQKRRASFASRDAAYERFARGPFTAWDPRALAAYVDHGFQETAAGWELRCAPAVEAEVYRQGSNVDTWDRLDEIACPVTILAGENSDPPAGYPADWDPYLSMLAERFSDVTVAMLDGLGHLAPMEDPAVTARAVRKAVAGT